MKVLVTGGCGFIGSHLVDELTSRGHEVRVIDNLEYQVHEGRVPSYLNPNVQYIFGNIKEKEEIREALAGIEVIFHQAAAVGVGQSMYEIERYVNTNIMGTAKLLDILVNGSHDVRKLVVASSMSIYGEGCYQCNECGVIYPKLRTQNQLKSRAWEIKCPHCKKTALPMPTSEEKQLHPTSVYAITKQDQEEMCLTVGKSHGLPTVALRYFNIYGSRQSLNNPYTGIAAIFSSRIKNNNSPTIFEDGLQSRDFIHVRDIIQANLLVMDSAEADYQVFNVGTGKPSTILGIAEMLIKSYGKSLKPTVVNKYRSGDIRHCYADISKIKRIGFKPKITIEQGMSELISWADDIKAIDRTEQAQKELSERGLIET